MTSVPGVNVTSRAVQPHGESQGQPPRDGQPAPAPTPNDDTQRCGGDPNPPKADTASVYRQPSRTT